jgi:hypothetical protein
MFTNTKFALSVAIMLGTASVATAAPQYSIALQAAQITRHKAPTSTYGRESLDPAPGQITRMSAEYFNPNPATFKAFTYCASVPLGPSNSKRVLRFVEIKHAVAITVDRLKRCASGEGRQAGAKQAPVCVPKTSSVLMSESLNVGHDGRAGMFHFEAVGFAVQVEQPT